MTPDAQSLSILVVEDNPLNAKHDPALNGVLVIALTAEVAAPSAWIVEVGAAFRDDAAEIQCLVVRRSCGLKGPDHTVAARLSAASRINTSR